jgi:hypothetical protein
MTKDIKTRGLYAATTNKGMNSVDHYAYKNKNLPNSNFSGRCLTLYSFENSILTNANFTNADLTRANFIKANLAGANLSDASLFNTKLYGAQFNHQTTFSPFELNHHLNSYKNSKHTSALFFRSLDDIPETLDHLAAANPQATLQAMVAHSLINKLVAVPADAVMEKLLEYKDHAFFAGYDWTAHYPSFLRGLMRGDSAMSLLNEAKMKLCAYFLINMPRLTNDQKDLHDAFLTESRKTQLNQMIKEDLRLKNMLSLEKLQENNCAFTHIINTRRHLFRSERKPNETKHSIQLFSLFKASINLSSSQNDSVPLQPRKGQDSP